MDKNIKQLEIKVSGLERIKKDIFLLKLFSPYIAGTAVPGNFLHIRINSVILRRPLSIHRVEGDKVYILFKVRGRGTAVLSNIKKDDVLDVIGPLGRGFSYNAEDTDCESQVLVAGGIGVAPLAFLAQEIKRTGALNSGVRAVVLLGARMKREVLCEDYFKRLGFKVNITTEDGSMGKKGLVTEDLRRVLSSFPLNVKARVYGCGPKEMFLEVSKILKKYSKIKCEVSFEQFMGCGLGICCACTIETRNGYKKVCKDGPVFNIKDVY